MGQEQSLTQGSQRHESDEPRYPRLLGKSLNSPGEEHLNYSGDDTLKYERRQARR